MALITFPSPIRIGGGFILVGGLNLHLMKIPGQAGCGVFTNTSSFAPRLLVGGFKIKMEIREQIKKDIIKGLDLNLKQFMEIVEPVNFTSTLSRWKTDHEWLVDDGIKKMLNKLKDITIAVEYLKNFKPVNKTKELMFKAFKEGQKRYKAEDMPIKLWIAGELENE